MTLIPYFLVGVAFGAVLLASEVISWFRIQEMFRFESFHMYGVIASAIVVAGVSIEIIKLLGLKGPDGRPLGLPPKQLGSGIRYVVGGMLFGIGWALTGACPGPLVALVGGGLPVMTVAITSALLGTWVYGYLRPRLPH